MFTTKHQQNHKFVDLEENIIAQTTIPLSHYAPLRAGFAGYPPNPRWTVTKYQAWKTGQKWKEALKTGEMKIRPNDNMLVIASEEETQLQEETLSVECFSFSAWAKQLIHPSSVPSCH